jgi:hypothetical protein
MSKPTYNADDKNIISVRIKRNSDVPDGAASLYSREEIRRFVSEFVSSWIRGDIIIRFPTAVELSKQMPLMISFPKDPSVSAELKIKEHYVNLLMVVAGIKFASAKEQDEAVSEVFKMMLMFRSSNRIEGRILSGDLEKRIQKLEEALAEQKALVDRITAHLFPPKRAKATKPKSKKTASKKGKVYS